MGFTNVGSTEGIFRGVTSGSDTLQASVPDLGAHGGGWVSVKLLPPGVSQTISSVTWGGQAMTQDVAATDPVSGYIVAKFFLADPPDNGSQDIVVTYNTSAVHNAHIVVTWASAGAAVSLDDTSSADGSAQNPTITSTQVGVDEMVISDSVSTANDIGAPAVTDCTLLQDWDQGGNCTITAYSIPGSSGNATHQHNYSQSGNYVIASASYKEAAGGADVTVACETAWAAGYALAAEPSASVAVSALPGEACGFALIPSVSASAIVSLPAASAASEAGLPAASAGATVSVPAAASVGEGLALSTSAGVSVTVVPAEAAGQGQPPDVFVGLIVEAAAAGMVAFGLPAVAAAGAVIGAPHADAAGYGFEPNPFVGLIVDLAPGYGAAFGNLPVVSAGVSVAGMPGIGAGAALEASPSAGAVVLVPAGDAAGFGLEPGVSAAALVSAPAGAAAALALPAAAVLPGGDIAVLAELGAALGYGLPAEAAIVVFGGLSGVPGRGQLAGEQEARLAGEKEQRLG